MSAAAGAAAAAAAYKQMIDEEEETMTKYSPDELEKWEFKILRSNTLSFKNTNELQKAVAEEKQSGWELVEKFDDSRLRFKRRITERDSDVGRTIDPYRAVYGMGSGTIVIWLFVGIIAFVLIIGMIGAIASS